MAFPREFCCREQARVIKPTFLQSWQKTEELPSSPSISPQSRHCERPFPMAFFLMFSSLSTRRLRARGRAAVTALQEKRQVLRPGQVKKHWEKAKELNLPSPLHFSISLKAAWQALPCPCPFRSRKARLKPKCQKEPGYGTGVPVTAPCSVPQPIWRTGSTCACTMSATAGLGEGRKAGEAIRMQGVESMQSKVALP